ncbi:MAG: hypothetical protein FJ293_06735 [Planctomycetes bacterium]|nr:hypothetical protein [Planctomycetota bacterium]
MKRLLKPLLLLCTATVLLVALWPKRRAPAALPAELAPYTFANALPALNPPLEALGRDVLTDPVRRTAARIEWGPPDVLYWSYRHLPTDRARLSARLLERLEPIRIGSPLLAQRLVDALGEVGDPGALPVLRRLAEFSPQNEEHLQLAAIRALSKFARDPETVALFERLSADPRPHVAATALQQVIEREAFATPEVIADLLAQYDAGEAIPLLQEVGRRRLADCADAAARHLASPAIRIRQNAIYALLAVGDPRGTAAALAEFDSDDAARRLEALTLFRDAAAPLPPERARALSDHPQGDVRRELAVALAASAGSAADPAVDALLTRLAGDPDPVVARVAAHQLFRRGRSEALDSWRETVRTGRGASLREALTFLCEVVQDPATAPLVRDRLGDAALDGGEQGNLLGGLRFIGTAEDAPHFLRRLLASGSADDRRAGEHMWLSDLATTHVQALGPGIGPALLAAWAAAPTLRAQLAALDALRGVLRELAVPDQQRCGERLLALVADETAPPELRLAAADTIAFTADATLGERLFALRPTLDDPELAARILALYASFF